MKSIACKKRRLHDDYEKNFKSENAGDSMDIEWVDGFEIRVKVDHGAVVIAATWCCGYSCKQGRDAFSGKTAYCVGRGSTGATYPL